MELSFSEELRKRFEEAHAATVAALPVAPKRAPRQPYVVSDPYVIESFDREDAEVVAPLTADGILILEHEGDRFRLTERGGNSLLVATTRINRIFKCRKCGMLDYVDRCICGSKDIAIFMEQSLQRMLDALNLASALKKIAPELIPQVLDAYTKYYLETGDELPFFLQERLQEKLQEAPVISTVDANQPGTTT